MNQNPINFWQLNSRDIETSVNFFKKVFGWEFSYDKETEIYHVSAKDFPTFFQGGFFKQIDSDDLPILTLFIRVEDIDNKVEMIKKNGGEIIKAPYNLPNGNRICLFKDPSGVILGMVQNFVFYRPCSVC